MSGQWEVVGKKKERKSAAIVSETGNKSNSKNKKNNILNGVKLEEVLPKSQVQNIYATGKMKDTKKPQEKAPKPAETKKVEKKLINKPLEPPKPKPPKSIESGLTLVNVDELKAIYEKNKLTYPETPIVWLKEIVQYLNKKLAVEIQDPVFLIKPSCYPLNVVPSNLKSFIEKSVQDVGRDNAQLYFDIALTSMVTDMSKGLPAIGYKFYLQQIALSEPNRVTANVKKHITLRNSYQNRANIGLSILWAVGHVGVNDFQSGWTVFEQLMLPLLEMKAYTRYITKYLYELLSTNPNISLTKEQYLTTLDTVFSNRKNVSPDTLKDLLAFVPKLGQTLFKNNKEKYHSYIETFLKKIPLNDDQIYQGCICDVLVNILVKDQNNYLPVWNKIYPKNLAASAVVLNYIGSNNSILSKLKKSSAFKELLNEFNSVNEDLLTKKRKDDGLKESVAAIKKINESAKKQPKKGSFFGSFFRFLLIVASVGVITETIYKVQQGRPEDSSFRKINSGIVQSLTWTNNRLQERFPEQHKIVADFSEPYIVLVRDLGKVGLNALLDVKSNLDPYVKEKYVVVVQTIDKYAPGVLGQCQKVLNDVCEKVGFYSNKSVQYLQNEVFVGQLSPDNMKKVVLEAVNTTSVKANEYYHWVHEKINAAIK